MRFSIRDKSIFNRALLVLLVLLLLSGLSFSGCTRTGAIPRGWSGVAVVGDSLYMGTMKGKRRSLAVAVIALIVLSAAVVIALGKSEDYFDVEDCKCTELENKGMILDEEQCESSTHGDYSRLYCAYSGNN